MMSAAAATHSISWRVSTSSAVHTTWTTPPALYLALDQEFHFTIDVAAADATAQCDRYFTKEDDALCQSWSGERVFCNPPYGRELERWISKAVVEAQEGGALVCMVLPARTGNRWFHQHCLPHGEVRFIRGRLGFSVGAHSRSRAPFDSMVVVFRPYRIGEGHIRTQPTFPGFDRA